MGRRNVLALLAAVAVLAAAAGWVAGRQIKSPGQIAAEQEPPEPSLITVPVELRTLSQDVVVRGTVRLSDETPLPVSSTLGSSVITQLLKEEGDRIEEGDVLIEVAGRPIIALQGALPAFRNLLPGLEGPDVEQLEEALVRLGYEPGTVDETFTTDTSAAVAALYRDGGYSAPEPDAALQGALDGAEAEVEARQAALTDARRALDEASSTVTDLERRQLDLAVQQAQAGLEAARAAASQARDEATRAVTDAQQALDDARSSGDQAAIAEAERVLGDASSAQARTSTEQDLAVTASELGVAEAEQARADRLTAPDLSDLQTALDEATTALSESQVTLTEAQAAVGAWMPTSEVVFLSSVPRQVSSLTVEIGDVPTDSVMTISGADTVIDSGVSAADRSLIEIGAEALMEDDDLGLSIEAVVSFMADSPGGPGLSDDRFALRFEPVGQIPSEAIGLNLRISIPITSSGGDVLAVPLAALSAGPDGTARVEVERQVGETELVDVSTGLRAEGFVQIEPRAGAALAEGDRVVVGRDLQLPGSSEGDDDTNSNPATTTRDRESTDPTESRVDEDGSNAAPTRTVP